MGQETSRVYPFVASGSHDSQFCLTNVTIEQHDGETPGDLVPIELTELCMFGVKPSEDVTCLALTRYLFPTMGAGGARQYVSSFLHSFSLPADCGDSPAEVPGVQCVVRCEDGEDIGFAHLGASGGPQVEQAHSVEIDTGDAQLHLTMSWRSIPTPIKERVLSVEDLDKMFDGMDYCSLQQIGATGDPSTVANTLSALRQILELTPKGHPRLPTRLAYLAAVSMGSFARTGEVSDIDDSVEAIQRAVEVTPENHPHFYRSLANLGRALLIRYQRTGNLCDINDVISTFRRGVVFTHEADPAFLGGLGGLILCRCSSTGSYHEMSEGISLLKRGVSISRRDDSTLPMRMTNLAQGLRSHFEWTGELSTVDEAITVLRQAWGLFVEDAERRRCLQALGNCFQSRFAHSGDIHDISEVITTLQKTVFLTPKNDHNLPDLLCDLGGAFTHRFERTGELSDINEAISAREKSILLCPPGHASRAVWLTSLGMSLVHRSRYSEADNLPDITRAVEVQQEAVRLTEDDDTRLQVYLNNLGLALWARYEHTTDLDDLKKTISTLQRAVERTPEGHLDLPFRLRNLGNAFACQWDNGRDETTVVQCISNLEKALELTPAGNAGMPGLLMDLGEKLLVRFGDSRDDDHRAMALSHFRTAAKCAAGPPKQRLRGAVAWARMSKARDPPSSEVLDAFRVAIRHVALIAGLEQSVQGRHQELQDFPCLALEAASAACDLGHPERAIEWLEDGRCLVWSQLSDLRTPLDELRLHDSNIAQRILDVSSALEIAASSRRMSNIDMSISEKISVEDGTRRHLSLAREWDGLLKKAREIPGFETFLLPTSFETLSQSLPKTGAVVIINVHEQRCDALALVADLGEPLLIPLPAFSFKTAGHYRSLLTKQVGSGRSRMRGDECERRLGPYVKPQEGIHRVLEGLWGQVVKPIMDALGYTKWDESSNDPPPRIWWCPTGPLSFLPLHAAGIYGEEGSESLLDYAVSSYTPTVTALTDRVKKSYSADNLPSGLFLTSQPAAPGAAPIPGTTAEVQSISALFTQTAFRTLKVDGDDLRVDGCLAHMEEFSSIHLACHASQNSTQPLQSQFLFHNGSLDLNTMMQRNLKNADLAFLSACQTSTGEEKLPDEAVHLAAGMLAAGYQRVVATMWSIGDEFAPKVAEDFYQFLLQHNGGGGGGFDCVFSAHALHYAIQELRKDLDNSEESLLAWAPYVHFGY